MKKFLILFLVTVLFSSSVLGATTIGNDYVNVSDAINLVGTSPGVQLYVHATTQAGYNNNDIFNVHRLDATTFGYGTDLLRVDAFGRVGVNRAETAMAQSALRADFDVTGDTLLDGDLNLTGELKYVRHDELESYDDSTYYSWFNGSQMYLDRYDDDALIGFYDNAADYFVMGNDFTDSTFKISYSDLGNDHFTINSDGQVGIGDVSPGDDLYMVYSAETMENNPNNYMRIYHATWMASDIDIFRIDGSGNVGIGLLEMNPIEATLHVVGDTLLDGDLNVTGISHIGGDNVDVSLWNTNKGLAVDNWVEIGGNDLVQNPGWAIQSDDWTYSFGTQLNPSSGIIDIWTNEATVMYITQSGDVEIKNNLNVTGNIDVNTVSVGGSLGHTGTCNSDIVVVNGIITGCTP